jgi:hypothetical protein
MVGLGNKYCHFSQFLSFKLQEELQNLIEIGLYLAESMAMFHKLCNTTEGRIVIPNYKRFL